MPKKTTMTEKIYEYLKKIIPEQGYAPSVREIGDAVGLRSPSTVHFHLKRLQEQGLIEKGDFKGRALVLTHQEEKNRIPILGNVAAGTPILAQECIEDYLTFECSGEEQSYFALRVRGDSMLNAGILPGDLVVVHRQQTANSGDIVVALLEDEATVKRLSHKDGGIWLLPENPNYAPIDGTHASLMGKVTAVVRRYR
ncbi:MAG: transcriptional repressor LexA [Oscillospiraceae bacterium]|nr:transcriptional repressor LexA [Oscillospiraceae bacterium]